MSDLIKIRRGGYLLSAPGMSLPGYYKRLRVMREASDALGIKRDGYRTEGAAKEAAGKIAAVTGAEVLVQEYDLLSL